MITRRRMNAASLRPFSKPSVRLVSLVFALVMLVVTGVLAYFTEAGVANSRDWVVHTYGVASTLENLQLTLADERASAMGYLLTRNDIEMTQYREGVQRIPRILAALRTQVRDPQELQQIDRLEALLRQHQAELDGFFAVEQRGNLPEATQSAALTSISLAHDEVRTLIEEMQQHEQALLRTRLHRWDMLFRRNLVALTLMFAAAILLLFYNFRFFLGEIARRNIAERLERENIESYRALSARIIELQDFERRKIARELHDSVGQYLAGLKLSLGRLATKLRDAAPGTRDLVSETLDLAERAVGEVRTISHLLHPPLLDELGLSSAVRWYAEGFAKRSGTQVHLELAEIADRLPREIELALFRVLQEALTNVHRHARATSAEVTVACTETQVTLTVKDNGRGIPREVLARFHSGLAGGIGLAGMKERLNELGGSLTVQSGAAGTTVAAIVPVQQLDESSGGAPEVAEFPAS